MTNTTHTRRNETVVSDPRVPRALAYNHNETVVTDRRTPRGIVYNHNETVVVRSAGER